MIKPLNQHAEHFLHTFFKDGRPAAFILRKGKWNKCKHGLSESDYLLERTLCPDALPSYKDPVIPEAQSVDNRAAQIRNETLGFIVEPTITET